MEPHYFEVHSLQLYATNFTKVYSYIDWTDVSLYIIDKVLSNKAFS